jgi:hypothetical protein
MGMAPVGNLVYSNEHLMKQPKAKSKVLNPLRDIQVIILSLLFWREITEEKASDIQEV